MTRLRADDGMQPYEIRAVRSSSRGREFRTLHRRLHLFSFVVPRPKEGEGDSLQLALRVADEPGARALLAPLALDDTEAVQRPSHGPFAGAVLHAQVSTHPLGTHGDPSDGVIVLVRLFDAEAPYEVTEALVERAEHIEQRLAALHVDRLPRETGLLGWITPDRHPALFE